MIAVYGLKNCDTCRKARQWLDGKGIAHRFHDVRADGLDERTVAGWVKELGFEPLMRVPDANVTWTEAGMLRHTRADVGVAVSIPGGLAR